MERKKKTKRKKTGILKSGPGINFVKPGQCLEIDNCYRFQADGRVGIGPMCQSERIEIKGVDRRKKKAA
ncbi:MAG: hypothetical protein A2487_02510 [Candidatus Raymondbacteria bacterium RifOxyC12_full_50_8]|uniref:Uncharacterized protein n=1 Tax=Candidatus Raymondbacteria bacterium RIFOXYD12_FULL_49_13 TaxID=1817890 RepID=A0A1F7FI37_UNCRA|nr:MAG: hypothetical protein A2248_21050 [Candidatus Raymondbacteria bacterium RIFOXYA2_FULL_49_16]OGJ95716.1 MAG: hypothetical protein A2350_12320 [Candidatus Raymondbacteria bacterium RifOxyB12_full_50_8]OGK06278.1 MAG: hypothetical protein A2519_08365 [Candidatus Raymondbacteria bacterium RIFOXYD12_FULL_49_13]OGK07733.1 MAG: hypothetical protein A2487_02510 [Candidatus Raymondbacteria bacterium RifOxyC12_full_50_8]OGP40610.1 MAG: hypothetical protein A2324_03120 [Candidatus Raymondbacteria b